MRFNKDSLGKIFLVLWVIVVVTVITFQMASHLLAMPLPKEVEKVRESLLSYQNNKEWLYVHIIYDKCSCTNLLIEHLVERKKMKEATEVIMLIGGSSSYEDQLIKSGFKFVTMKKETVEKEFGIEAAPILAVINGNGELKYLGGYFKTSAAKYPKDIEIISHINKGSEVEALPLYGCAISDVLKSYIDPLGVSEI